MSYYADLIQLDFNNALMKTSILLQVSSSGLKFNFAPNVLQALKICPAPRACPPILNPQKT